MRRLLELPWYRAWIFCSVLLLVMLAHVPVEGLCPLAVPGIEPLPGHDSCPRGAAAEMDALLAASQDIYNRIGGAISNGIERQGFAYVHAGFELSDDDLLSIMRNFGEPYHQSQHVMQIFPEPKPQFIARSREGIEFHHEVAYMPQPPRFLALYCRTNSAQGGTLLLCDADDVLAALDTSILDLMRSTKFLNTLAPNSGPMPLIRAMPSLGGAERFIFSAIGINTSKLYFYPAPGFEDGGQVILAALRPVLRECPGMHQIMWHPGDLLVVDNLRIMHGRYEFDGGERELAHIRIK